MVTSRATTELDRIAAARDRLAAAHEMDLKKSSISSWNTTATARAILASLSPLEKVEFLRVAEKVLANPNGWLVSLYKRTHLFRDIAPSIGEDYQNSAATLDRKAMRHEFIKSLTETNLQGAQLSPKEAALLFRALVESEMQNLWDAPGTDFTPEELKQVDDFVVALRAAVADDRGLRTALSAEVDRLDAKNLPDAQHGVAGTKQVVASHLDGIFARSSGGVCASGPQPSTQMRSGRPSLEAWAFRDDPKAVLKAVRESNSDRLYLASPIEERQQLPLTTASPELQNSFARNVLVPVIGRFGCLQKPGDRLCGLDQVTAADRDEAFRALMTLPPEVAVRALANNSQRSDVFEGGLTPAQQLQLVAHLLAADPALGVRIQDAANLLGEPDRRLMQLESLAHGLYCSADDQRAMVNIFGDGKELCDLLKTMADRPVEGKAIVGKIHNHTFERLDDRMHQCYPVNSETFYLLANVLRGRVEKIMMDRGADLTAPQRTWIKETWSLP